MKNINIIVIIVLIAVFAWYFLIKKKLLNPEFRKAVAKCKEFRKTARMMPNAPSCEEQVAKQLGMQAVTNTSRKPTVSSQKPNKWDKLFAQVPRQSGECYYKEPRPMGRYSSYRCYTKEEYRKKLMGDIKWYEKRIADIKNGIKMKNNSEETKKRYIEQSNKEIRKIADEMLKRNMVQIYT